MICEMTDKLNTLEIKNCSVTGYQRLKGQATGWYKIFVSAILYKRL